MTSEGRKSVFISHSSHDENVALKLYEKILDHFGEDEVWVDFFDLDGAVELVATISDAIQKAGWFILLASKASMASRWVTYEARLATFLAIEREDFQILTIKLDNCTFPRQLDVELRRRKYLDATTNQDQTFEQVIELLRKDERLSPRAGRVFVDRGNEFDRIELAINRDKIIHLIGMQGIGKSSFVREVARRYGRRLIQVDLRIGHDLELLCRQILGQLGQPQPERNLATGELLQKTIEGLRMQVSQNLMLFLNNAENCMTDEGAFRPFLRDFLNECMSIEMGFPIFVASIRRSELRVEEVSFSTPFHLQGLTNEFMIRAIQQWHSLMQVGTPPPANADLSELVEKLAGYPLAAKLVAGYLTFGESPKSLARRHFFSRFQLQIAEFMVKTVVRLLAPLDKQILSALAIYGTGMTTEQLCQTKTINHYELEEIHNSLAKLTSLMLLVQDAEIMKLHPYIAAYFVDTARQEGAYSQIAEQLAEIAWKETREVSKILSRIPQSQKTADNLDFIRLERRLLLIAEPAHRLLLATGQSEKAEQLPWALRGHLREMVFIMYQEIKDYKSCIDFARQWLRLDPNDTEVKLYMARAYRRQKDYDNANRILSELERVSDLRLVAKVARERGLICYNQGDLEGAIHAFRIGSRFTRSDGALLYPQVSINLAQALIADSSHRWDGDPQRAKNFSEAAMLLEKAREYVPRFDSEHSDRYVYARLQAGEISAEEAIAELRDLLEFQPDNSRVHFRLAEILKDNLNRLSEALEHAEKARQLGSRPALLLIAHIRIDREEYEQALDVLKGYMPETEQESAVKDVLTARALVKAPEQGRKLLERHRSVNDSFLAHARAQIEFNAAQKALLEQRYGEARQWLYTAKTLAEAGRQQYHNQRPFELLLAQIADLERRLGNL